MYHFRRLDATVDELLAQGRHADAAAAARGAGDAARAATIYAQIWDFRRAAECALEAGDRLAAIAHLIDARAPGEAVALADSEGTDRAAAASLLAARRLFGPAAALLEKLGERERAAELFQRAGQTTDAARVLEDLGRLREAGRLLERIAAGETATTAEERAAAQLALGRILARLGHHEEAVRHLQEASRHESTRARALPLIAPELAALGWSHAAAEAARGLGGAPPVALLPAAPSDAETPLIGGRYLPLRLLGAGAAGRVFLCRDEVSGAEVALKLFTVAGGAGTQGGDSYRRFLREAEIWRRAHHPNILRILDLRPDLGFLVTELAEGGTLADRRGRLPPGRVRRIALDVLAGLGHAHERGVVHRDVKPANVFLDGRGVAKLGDFGVAHLLDLGATQTGALIGTLAYMSPEQITGASLGAAADLYALGVTLFEALTGRRPFLGPDFIAQHLGEPPPRAAEIEPSVPAAWDLLLGDLLAKDPAARPGSAAEVAERVRALEGPGPRPILTLPRPPTPATDGAPPERAAPEAAEPRSRYEGETPIGETPTARLSRAVDRALERTVVIERFVDGAPDAASERRLFGLAAAGTPFVQRVLSYDRTARVAVYEAPVGEPATAADIPRIAGELARALTALAEVGCVHGAVAAARVLYDEQAGTTLLAAGLPAADPAATSDDDARAVAELLTGLRADAPSG